MLIRRRRERLGRAWRAADAFVTLALVLAACGGNANPSARPATAAPTASASTLGDAGGATPGGAAAGTPGVATTPSATAPGPDRTVWLCRPGLAQNPCEGDLTTTVIEPNGSRHVEKAAPDAAAAIDCFYVYPTVSRQATTNASLRIDPEERAVAVAQAARFSQVCRVYAPMYPQLTLAAIEKPGGITLAGALAAYAGVANAFEDYLARYNHGRGIVFLGHSQGASLLVALLKREVDADPATRRLLVSAVLLGGNVTVASGSDRGGDFANIPACASTSQTGCVVAYSSFTATPPPDAKFGRVGSGLDPFAPSATAGRSLQVLCVNPAGPGRDPAVGTLEPFLPAQTLAALGVAAPPPSLRAATAFVAFPGEYRASCISSGGASWLEISPVPGVRPLLPLSATGGASWGLHTLDVNVALGNLVRLVGEQAAAYRR